MYSPTMTSEPTYRDSQYSRMLVILGAFIVFGVGVAVGAVFGVGTRLAVWVVCGLVLLALVRRTRIELTIDRAGIRVGRAHIEWQHIARVEVLTADAMRAALTTDGHPNDFLRIRGTTAGLRVWLDDASDPHRAWLMSVRQPAALGEVLRRLPRAEARHA